MLTIEQRLQHLEDEAAIRDLAARFADAATRADYETIRSLFSPDAVFTIGEPFAVTCKGPNEIVALIHKLRDGKDFFVQFVHSGLVQLDGVRALACARGGYGSRKERFRKELLQQFWIFHR